MSSQKNIIVHDSSKAFSINNIELQMSDDKAVNALDIIDFIGQFKYDIDKLYIDKFWNSIQNNGWIVVDYAMLRWIGYACKRDADNKKKYDKTLNDNFSKGDDYHLVSPNNNYILDLKVQNKNTIIVTSETFKSSLMMLRTERAKTIRKYYLMLERIMFDYMKYTKLVSDHNSALTIKNASDTIRDLQNQLLESKKITFDIDTTPVRRKEYVYVLTSKRYYKQHLFKIGKTINPNQRLHGYNTGSAFADDEMFYVAKIPTFDCGGLEKQLQCALKSYHHSKEWFRIPQKYMTKIINLINIEQKSFNDEINSQLNEGFGNIENIPLNDFMNQINESQKDTQEVIIEHPKNSNESIDAFYAWMNVFYKKTDNENDLIKLKDVYQLFKYSKCFMEITGDEYLNYPQFREYIMHFTKYKQYFKANLYLTINSKYKHFSSVLTNYTVNVTK